tara:strand:+ start:285 stop:560 length:276 start_codon:yes stop_codon:yes gene_type:complete
MTDSYSTLIATLNFVISDFSIKYKCSKEDALEKYIIPALVKEFRDRGAAIMDKNDLDLVKKSVESLNIKGKQVELFKNILQVLEETMHGNN